MRVWRCGACRKESVEQHRYMTAKKMIFSLFILLVFGCGLPLYSYDAVSGEQPLKVIVQMDRFAFTDSDPVMLNVIIKNTSQTKQFFVIYDTPYTTFQPVVYEASGREADIAVPYRVMNRRIDEVIRELYPRTVELMPNETMEHSVNLKTLYDLKTGVEYKVKGYFLPDAKTPVMIAGDNTLPFKINRSPDLVIRSGVARVSRGVSPSEIVLLALTAEKSGDWENYFKYIQSESFINAFPEYVREYAAADEVEKLKVLEELHKFLSRDRSDYIRDFRVENQVLVPDKDIAYVEAVVKRYGPRATFNYRYKYTLARYKDYWLIIDLEATVMKGERP